MKRREFIAKGGIVGVGAAAAATTLSAPAIAADRVEIAMVSTWPRDFPGLGLSAQRLAARITELSNGKLKCNYFAAGEKVGAFDVFDALSSRKSAGCPGACDALNPFAIEKYIECRNIVALTFIATLSFSSSSSWILFCGKTLLPPC